jgi:hypothetical protein
MNDDWTIRPVRTVRTAQRYAYRAAPKTSKTASLKELRYLAGFAEPKI